MTISEQFEFSWEAVLSSEGSLGVQSVSSMSISQLFKFAQ